MGMGVGARDGTAVGGAVFVGSSVGARDVGTTVGCGVGAAVVGVAVPGGAVCVGPPSSDQLAGHV